MSDSPKQSIPLFRLVCQRVSEYFREAAVLVIVFSFLDKIVLGHEVRPLYVCGVMATSFLLLGLGIWLERRFAG